MTLKKTFINFPEWLFQIFSEMRIFINELYNLLHNFTMTPYCQHTLNFKKKKTGHLNMWRIFQNILSVEKPCAQVYGWTCQLWRDTTMTFSFLVCYFPSWDTWLMVRKVFTMTLQLTENWLISFGCSCDISAS